MLFIVDYICTRKDVEIIEFLKSALEKSVLVNIHGAWLGRNDMECMFHDNMQLDGEVSTCIYFKLLIFKLVYMTLYSFLIQV